MCIRLVSLLQQDGGVREEDRIAYYNIGVTTHYAYCQFVNTYLKN